MTLVLRPAEEGDIRKIRDLLDIPEIRAAFPRANVNIMFRAAKSSNTYLLVKEVDGEFAGISFIKIRLRTATLSAVNHPAYQNKGVSTETLQILEQKARDEWGVRKLMSIATPHNPAVVMLLTKAGFTRKGNLFTKEVVSNVPRIFRR